MSPVEIPGSVMKFLTTTGKKKCPRCRRDYRLTKLKQKGGVVYKLCPHCSYTLTKFNMKTALRLSTKRKK